MTGTGIIITTISILVSIETFIIRKRVSKVVYECAMTLGSHKFAIVVFAISFLIYVGVLSWIACIIAKLIEMML